MSREEYLYDHEMTAAEARALYGENANKNRPEIEVKSCPSPVPQWCRDSGSHCANHAEGRAYKNEPYNEHDTFAAIIAKHAPQQPQQPQPEASGVERWQ